MSSIETEKKAETVTEVSSPSEESKKELRAKKFGVQLESGKLEKRAERFGALKDNGNVEAPSKEKLDKRAERFGTVKSNNTEDTVNNTKDSSELKEKRLKRFNLGATEQASTVPQVSDEKLNKRKERFAIVNEDDKKKLRGERFEKV